MVDRPRELRTDETCPRCGGAGLLEFHEKWCIVFHINPAKFGPVWNEANCQCKEERRCPACEGKGKLSPSQMEERILNRRRRL